MDERLRKELLRSELKERNNGKKIIRCKYRPKYPDSAEREYVRLINAYMTIEKEVLMKYIPEIKQILNDGTQLHTDSKKDNEKKRRTARFSALDNTIVRLTILFKTKRLQRDSDGPSFKFKGQRHDADIVIPAGQLGFHHGWTEEDTFGRKALD